MEYILAWLLGNCIFWFGLYLLSLIGLRVKVKGSTEDGERVWVKMNLTATARGLALWYGIVALVAAVLMI